MRLVDDGAQLLHRQRRLRHQGALLVHPRAMRHVHLDPVGAVVELLARGLARLDRTVDELRALRHRDLGGIALQLVAAGAGDRARRDEHARPRDDALVDRALDADVAVAGALGLDVADGGEALLQGTARGHDRARHAVRGRVVEQLHVVTAGFRHLALEKDVGVAVDEPGQQGGVAEVEDLRAVGRRLRAARIHRGDAIAADQDLLIVQRPGAGPVDERRGAHHHDVLRRSTCKARPRQAQTQSSEAQVTHVEAPRLRPGACPAAAPWAASLARPPRPRKPRRATSRWDGWAADPGPVGLRVAVLQHRKTRKAPRGAEHFVAGAARTVRMTAGPAGAGLGCGDPAGETRDPAADACHPPPRFRRWFYGAGAGKTASSRRARRHAEYPPFRQTLSVKAAWGGHEDYFVDGRRVSVHDDTFLILNERRTYASCLHSLTPVTSFAVFFRPGMAAEVARCHALAPEMLLEHWHEPGPGVEFAEHSRRHDRLITPVLRFIRHHAEAGLTDEGWYEEQLYFLLQRMHALHRRDLAAAALLPVRRAATRRELFRRLGLCSDFMHAHYAHPLRLADIASAGHLSPYYCLRLFQALHRTTPTRYLSGSPSAHCRAAAGREQPARRGDRGPCRLRRAAPRSTGTSSECAAVRPAQ